MQNRILKPNASSNDFQIVRNVECWEIYKNVNFERAILLKIANTTKS